MNLVFWYRTFRYLSFIDVSNWLPNIETQLRSACRECGASPNQGIHNVALFHRHQRTFKQYQQLWLLGSKRLSLNVPRSSSVT